MSQSVLLTGATGFLGSHLLRALLEHRYHVVVLKRSTSNSARIESFLNDIQCIDIDKTPIASVFEHNVIDCVIHTACNYGRSNDSLIDIVDANLMFALRVLQQAVTNKVECFINTATILPNDINPYALSKYQFGEWLKFYQNKIQVIDIKIEHMYGPGDDTQKFLPWLLDRLINSEQTIKLTAGEQKRDFIYIDDVVDAYLTLLKQRTRLCAWNEFAVASNEPIRIKDLVLKLVDLVKTDVKGDIGAKLDFGALPYRDGEIMDSVVDTAKLKALGWRAKTSLDLGLKNFYLNQIRANQR